MPVNLISINQSVYESIYFHNQHILLDPILVFLNRFEKLNSKICHNYQPIYFVCFQFQPVAMFTSPVCDT